ncbi:MAG: alpha/beta fold hydrolase [Jiangellales bacterium]
MDSTRRHDVTFTSGTDTIAAWWYPGGPGRRSCVVMAHGAGGTKRSGLAPFAERFADDGHHVLVIDYRHFGDSGGQPRQLLDPHRQVADLLAALQYARSRDDVDPNRIGLWGTSFGGGNVLVAAVRDQHVAAVISQGPALDGFTALTRSLTQPGQTPVSWARTLGRVASDLTAAALGREPTYVPLVGPPGSAAIMTAADSEPGYQRIAGPDWVNAACARLALTVPRYRPVSMAGRVPCPWLIQICQRDTVAPTSSAEKAARRAGARATVRRYDIDHFAIYVDDGFEQAITDQTAFLRHHLTPNTAPE